MSDVLKDCKSEMREVIDNFKEELKKIRTGRATVSMLDGIKVEYYGSLVPLNQVGAINVVSADMLVIKPWEQKMFPVVEKAIRSANLGFNPINDGKQIKVPVPPLSEERRKELVKKVKMYLEERKTSIRNIRRDYREIVKEMKESKEISEDEERKLFDEIQKLTDEHIKELEKMVEEKEKEIMEV